VSTVALLTDRRYESATAGPDDWYVGNILEEDRLLSTALRNHGLTTERVDWHRPDVDWSRFECAVFRTTWDYFERIDEFLAWLERVDGETTFLNPLPLVRWNLDKRYLADLERAGVAVVPTRFLEDGDTLAGVFADTEWGEVVLKPVVSGSAFETYRISADQAARHESHLRTLLSERAMLVQPFQPAIVDDGEVTLMLFAGQMTHAVRKRAKPGDFRVQDDHGGTVHAHDAAADEIALAEAAMAACSPAPVYGRVDMVRDPDGVPRIMELELIEPELWMRMHPPSAERMAAAIAAYLPARAPNVVG
jgi:glutathione synthase/RimK-type ligase-like ATP-grasp enzyme